MPLSKDQMRILLSVSATMLKYISKHIMETTSAIDDVLNKVDHLILREIKVGFEALYEASLTTNTTSRDIRLRIAEENLLKGTTLSRLTVGGYASTYWVARCHYGLRIICDMRNDSRLCARNALKAFSADAQLSRTTLMPDVFESVFKPLCKDIYAWHADEIKKANENTFSWKIGCEAGIFAASGLAAGATLICCNPLHRPGVYLAMKHASDRFAAAKPEKFRAERMAELYSELNRFIDSKCKEIADNTLKFELTDV